MFENKLELLKMYETGSAGNGSADSLGNVNVRNRITGETAEAKSQASNDLEADPWVELKASVLKEAIRDLGSKLYHSEEDLELPSVTREAIGAHLKEMGPPMSRVDREKVLDEICADILGYGPIEEYLKDDSVTEIMVNGADSIFIERNGKIIEVGERFADNDHLLRIIDRMVAAVGRRIDEASPMVDARLPDGSRINAIIPPLAIDGPCLTVRKFRRDPFRMEDLVEMGTLSQASAKFLELCIEGGANVLVSGGTGVGKTTTLNVLSSAIPDRERIVTIEDSAELQLSQRHTIRLETRPSNIEGQGEIKIRDLVRNSLRMRPDRIIVGEYRGAEAVDMLQAMNTGHDGCLTTIHANSARDALNRLETLVLTAGVELPLRAIREQISNAFDLVIQVARLVDGSRKIVSITEVGSLEGEVITMQDIYNSKVVEGAGDDELAQAGSRLMGPIEPTGVIPQFLTKLRRNGVRVPEMLMQETPNKGTLRSRIATPRSN